MTTFDPELLANARAAAEKGRAWLHESGPIYGLRPLAKVNLTRLNINSCTTCVLGQLSGQETDGFSRVVEVVFTDTSKSWSERKKWAMEHGFMPDVKNGVDHTHLNKVWKDLVKEERAQ
jgi:hypothetical protein